VLAVDGPLSPELAADYLLQACVGIAEAHALGIIHRDLKPGNLFLTARGDGSHLIKVLDFGIAKAPVASRPHELTSSLHVIGSPGYMSPEQIRSSRAVDARSDIWSLGVTLYELVTGHLPFVAKSVGEVAVMITNDPTPPIAASHHGLDDVIAACLQKSPDHRFADVAAFAAALEPFAQSVARRPAAVVKRLLEGGESVTLRRPAVSATDITVREADTVAGKVGAELAVTTLRGASGVIDAVTVPLARRPRRRWMMLAGAVVVGILVGVGLAMRGTHDEPGAPEATHVAAPPAPAAFAPQPPVALPSPPDAPPDVPSDAGTADAATPSPQKAHLRQPATHAPADAGDPFEKSRI
jgi:serine/threonine-protein kinase